MPDEAPNPSPAHVAAKDSPSARKSSIFGQKSANSGAMETALQSPILLSSRQSVRFIVYLIEIQSKG